MKAIKAIAIKDFAQFEKGKEYSFSSVDFDELVDKGYIELPKKTRTKK